VKSQNSYTEDEKTAILELVEARPKGQSICARCKEIGYPEGTVTKWRSNRRPKTFAKLKPVKPERPTRKISMPLPGRYSGWD